MHSAQKMIDISSSGFENQLKNDTQTKHKTISKEKMEMFYKKIDINDEESIEEFINKESIEESIKSLHALQADIKITDIVSLNALNLYFVHLQKIPLMGKAETLSLFRRLKSGDTSVHSALVCGHLRLAVYAAAKRIKWINGFHQPLLLDIISDAHIGLLRAVDLFDPDRGFAFSTYALYWIRESMSRFFIKNMNVVHIPIYINKMVQSQLYKKNSNDYPDTTTTAAIDSLTITSNIKLSAKAIIAEDKEHYALLARQTVCIDSLIGAETTTILNDDEISIENQCHVLQVSKILYQHFNELNEEERHALFFYTSNNVLIQRMTLKSIGQLLNVSHEQVRSISRKAAQRLKKSIETQEIELEGVLEALPIMMEMYYNDHYDFYNQWIVQKEKPITKTNNKASRHNTIA